MLRRLSTPFLALSIILAALLGGSALAHHRPWHSGGPQPSPSPSPSSSPSPSPSPTAPPAPAVKELVKGLGNRDRTPQVSEFPTTLKVSWSSLQPGSVEADFVHPNPIDNALAAGEPFRVRIMGGLTAPPWVKNAAGTFPYLDPPACDTQIGIVPRWWTSAHIGAIDRFVQRFEAEYGSHDLVRAVTLFAPMTQYAEPFIKGTACPGNRQAMLSAGYTFAGDKAAFEAAIASHGQLTTTRTILSFNPWQKVNADGSSGTDMPATLAIMNDFRSQLGARAILQNNSIRWWDSNGDGQPDFGPRPVAFYNQIYDRMVLLGPPFSFQTAESAKFNEHPGTMDDTVQHACDIGAHHVELPGNYNSHLTATQKAALDACLKAN